MANAEPVSAVVFDVGNVLFEWDLRHLYAKLIADPGELEWFVGNVVTQEWHFRHDEGARIVDTIPARIAEFPEHEALIRAFGERFGESIPGPVPGSLELVDALHMRGVPLYAITNFSADFWPPFRALQPVFDVFRDIVVSGDELLYKPQPAIFALAARRFGHAPAKMLFIDDNAANIASARECGWQVHHFRDAPTLAADLRERGLIA
jgi:2-haloacid dehalogenase